MGADYGSDIRLGASGDIAFTADGDVEVVSGGALAAQDVRTEVLLSPGSCFWAPEFGQGLRDAFKGPNVVDVRGRLRAAAMNDERIYFDSVETSTLGDGRYLLSFQLLGSVDPVELYFD